MRLIAPDNWNPRGVPALEPAALSAVRETVNSLVVAGPGAGKTELLAQRASYLLETGICPTPLRILAISFKRDAARNLRDRVALRCGQDFARRFESLTFDAWAKSLLDRFRLALPENYRPTAGYQIDGSIAYAGPLTDRLISICEGVGISVQRVQQANVEKFFRDAVVERPINENQIPAYGTASALVQALWRSALNSEENSTLNFAMIASLAELLLRANPAIVKAIRNTYHFVFLDEFQDTTSSQYRLLHTAFHASHSILTAVGDNKQRIMLWAGAKSTVFEVFIENFAALKHGLVLNYRSAPRLVEIQQHIIASLDAGSPISSAVDDGTGIEGECRLLKFAHSDREGQYLANLIHDWIHEEQIDPAEICILSRQRPDVYSQALRNNLAASGVKCRVQNELQDLLSEPLAIVVIDALRVCCGGKKPIHWVNLCDLTLRLRGLEADDKEARTLIHNLSLQITEMKDSLAGEYSEQAIIALIKGLLSFLDEPAFRRLHHQYLQDEFYEMTITSLARNLFEYRSACAGWSDSLDDFVGIDCVPVMSIHKSKGLEFHTVILIGLEDYPFRNITEGNLEEECSFFVALSRAKKRVVFTTADTRITAQGARAQHRNDVVKLYELLGNAGVSVEEIE